MIWPISPARFALTPDRNTSGVGPGQSAPAVQAENQGSRPPAESHPPIAFPRRTSKFSPGGFPPSFRVNLAQDASSTCISSSLVPHSMGDEIGSGAQADFGALPKHSPRLRFNNDNPSANRESRPPTLPDTACELPLLRIRLETWGVKDWAPSRSRAR